MSKAKVKERRALKEEKIGKKRTETSNKKAKSQKTPFKERHANIFRYFWKIWFVGLALILIYVLIQLYQIGKLDILLPKERTF